MGIDRIGSGSPPGPPDLPEAPAAGARSSSFCAIAPKEVDPAAPATGALEQLRTGAVDLGGYVDLKVAEATEHLSSHLPRAQLEAIRSALRDRLVTDPALVDLVRAAGQVVTTRSGNR